MGHIPQNIWTKTRKVWLDKPSNAHPSTETNQAEGLGFKNKEETIRQSELLESDDIIGDLSSRNKGESVVKIRDISLPKTSR